MIKWAIRHKPTGRYLPEVGPRQGYTGSEPIDMGSQSAYCPRLFATASAAKCALTWWLKGITTATYYRNDWLSGIDDDEAWKTWMPEVDPEWMVERRFEDMEIVKLKLDVV